MINLNIERLKLLPMHSEAIWEGGWHPLEKLRISGNKANQEYRLGMWVCLENGLVGPGTDMVHSTESATPSKMLDLLASFACNFPNMGYCPGKVRVNDQKTADYLAPLLAHVGIEVSFVAEMAQWELHSREMNHQLNQGPGSTTTASLFANPELGIDQIIRFGEAAAEYYQAAPWHEFSDHDLIRIVAPHGGPGLEYTVILGWADLEYGLGFYSKPEQHDDHQTNSEDEDYFDRYGRIWLFTFNDCREAGFRDVFSEWEKKGMPLAGKSAYPLLLSHHPQAGPKPPNSRELDYLSGLLLALARCKAPMADRGRWSVTVPSGQGQVQYDFELPYVLNPLSFQDSIRWGIKPDPRANDLMYEAMAKTMNFDPADADPDAEIIFNDKFSGKTAEQIIEEADWPPTKAREADLLCTDAYQAVGYLKQVLARKALSVDPGCIRAWSILAEENSDARKSLEFYKKGLAAAKKKYDLLALCKEHGDLAGQPKLRPVLQVLGGVCFQSEKIGNIDEALQSGLLSLACTPVDGVEVRHFVMGELLARGRLEDASRVLQNWPTDYFLVSPDGDEMDSEMFMMFGGDMVFVAVSQLILAAHEGSPETMLKNMVKEINSINRYVLRFLNTATKPPATALENYSPGGGAVALLVGTELKQAWQNTPGLIELGKKKKGKKKRKRR